MGDVGCLMIFVCLLASVYPENYPTKYQTNLNFQKKTCNDEDIAFMLHNVPTSLTCSSICASDDDCESFFYFPKSLRCDGCKQTYSTNVQLEGAGEPTVYYSMATHLTTTSNTITTTTTTEGEEGFLYSGCFIVLCEGSQFCNYSIRIPLIDINVKARSHTIPRPFRGRITAKIIHPWNGRGWTRYGSDTAVLWQWYGRCRTRNIIEIILDVVKFFELHKNVTAAKPRLTDAMRQWNGRGMAVEWPRNGRNKQCSGSAMDAAQTCYCGLLYNPNLTADCDEPCEGNPDELCGGNYTMSVYIRNG